MSAGSLAGRRVVVSAGPTFEDLDPVRFLGNRSSGKMGFAVAEACAALGAEVVLVAGPVSLDTPVGVARTDVRSAAQMHAAVLAALPADAYVGAAAIADFTPEHVASQKIKKHDLAGSRADELVLRLVRTADVLADVATHARRPRLVVGFAAETHDVEAYARDKLERKKVDLIAANRVGTDVGFERDDNLLHVIAADEAWTLGPASKRDVAAALVALIAHRLPLA